jgi:hypothetical protein
MGSPVKSPRVTQPWGRPNPRYSAKRHTGIDFGMPVGTPLIAICDAKVSKVLNDKSYGLVVAIEYTVDNVKYETWYCHMSKQEVGPGQVLKEGSQLGLSGNTGNSTGPHLHLETRIAPFRYGNDVACPILLDMPGVIDPNAPADRKPKLLGKIVAAVTPAPKSSPATKNVSFSGTMAQNSADISIIQSALVDLVGAKIAPNGKWDANTSAAYKKWQESLGYKGKDADGKPGRTSLTKLGDKYGFKLV